MLISKNPHNDKVIAEYQEYNFTQVKDIISDVVLEQSSWSRLTYKDRSDFILCISQTLESEKKNLSELITEEMGKPISESMLEIEKCIWLCQYYSEKIDEFLTPEVIKTDAKLSEIHFEPLGVILGVMPWNFPYWQVFRFIVPALLAGNGVLLKHASNVQGCALQIEKVLIDSGLPENIFRTLVIGSKVIPDIIKDDAVKAVSLTGSEFAGSSVAELAGKNLKKSVMELGGSDAFIVLDDCDIEKAVKGAVTARMINNGQSCIAAKRFILSKSIHDEFVDKLIDSIGALKIGNPMNLSTDVGPLAKNEFLDDILRQIEKSILMGAKLVSGGVKIGESGYYMRPAILTNVTESMPVFNEETFGPVFSIVSCDNIEQMIKLANNSDYGLGGSVWTQNIELGKSIAHQIETGAVFVNAFTKSDPRMPFGGVKKSGYGRELSRYGLLEFCNIKSISIF